MLARTDLCQETHIFWCAGNGRDTVAEFVFVFSTRELALCFEAEALSQILAASEFGNGIGTLNWHCEYRSEVAVQPLLSYMMQNMSRERKRETGRVGRKGWPGSDERGLHIHSAFGDYFFLSEKMYTERGIVCLSEQAELMAPRMLDVRHSELCFAP